MSREDSEAPVDRPSVGKKYVASQPAATVGKRITGKVMSARDDSRGYDFIESDLSPSSSDSEDDSAASESALLDAVTDRKGRAPSVPLHRQRVGDLNKRKRLLASSAPAAAPPKRQKRGTATTSESPEVLADDARSREPHPVYQFLLDNTPVKPCGRCSECRKAPCGACANCKNNEGLTERSRDRKRCTEHGCKKLTAEQLQRYRGEHAESDTAAGIRAEISALRDRFMRDDPDAEELKELQQRQQDLMQRLKALMARGDSPHESAPEGYECMLLTISILETERDRLARFVERRRSRDSPSVMRTRRQLRNYYGQQICVLTTMFSIHMVSMPCLDALVRVATEYEKFLHSIHI
jgi:hypothetical protein